MKIRKNLLQLVVVFLTVGFIFSLLELGCTKVDYNNPLDPNGTSYAGDTNTADDDGDGIANMYDPDNVHYVKDTIAPVIKILGKDPDTILLNDPEGRLAQIAASIKATDNKEPYDITNQVKYNLDDVQIFTKGSYTLKYTVQDPDGNPAAASRTIVVWSPGAKDTSHPIITLFPNKTTIQIRVGDTVPYPKVTAIDINESGNVDLTNSIKKTGDVNPNVVGIYYVKYDVTDADGNAANEVILTVQVIAKTTTDLVPPEIHLSPKDTTIKVGQPYVDKGVTARDTKDDGLTFTDIPYDQLTITVKDKNGNAVPAGISGINTAAEGKYTITYSVSDGTSTTTQTRTVTITNGPIIINNPPVITLKGSADTSINVGSTWVDPKCTVSDDNDQNLVATATITNNGAAVTSIATTKADTFLITYNVTDKNGAAADPKTRTVTVKAVVVDKEKPVVKVKPDTITLIIGDTYSDTGITVTDDLDPNPTVTKVYKNSTGTIVQSITTTTAGKFTITYTATDASGKTSTAVTRTVIVKNGNTGSLLDKYGIDTAPALPATLPTSFTSFTTDGTPPTLTNLKSLDISWSNSQLYHFALNFNGPPYNTSLSPTQTFASAKPTLTLASSGISALDGKYYVVYSDNKFIWVKDDGSFAIIWAK